MSATKLQANWSACQFNSTVILHVTNVSFSEGGSLAEFSGDADVYPTVIANLMNNPSCSLTTGDEAALLAFTAGQTATFTATHLDAKLAAGFGVIYTMINAVFETSSPGGAHAAFGSSTGSWKAFSADGITNPLSFARG